MSNTYGDLTSRVGIHAEKELLKHAAPVLCLNYFAQHKPLPKNNGDTIKFRRARPLAPAMVALTEGVQPAAGTFIYDDVPATVKEYGDWLTLTNKIIDLHEDAVGRDMAEVLGEQAALTTEMITWGELQGGNNALWANGTDRTQVNTTLSLGLQRQAVKILKAQKGRMFSSVLSGSAMYGTSPIEASYIGLAHTDLDPHIRNLKGFVPTAKYGQRSVICDQELGTVENIRYVTSPEFAPFIGEGGLHGDTLINSNPASPTLADIYPIIYLAKDAFGAIPLKGDANLGGYIKPKVRQPGKPMVGDEMGRTGSVSWCTWFTAKILNDGWMVRAEVAAEIDPSDPA